jgi:hypothetical protein
VRMAVSVVLDFGICSLVGVTQIARLVIVAVHQLQQAIHEVIDVLKAPRRLAVPVDCNILACARITRAAFSVYSLLSVFAELSVLTMCEIWLPCVH